MLASCKLKLISNTVKIASHNNVDDGSRLEED